MEWRDRIFNIVSSLGIAVYIMFILGFIAFCFLALLNGCSSGSSGSKADLVPYVMWGPADTWHHEQGVGLVEHAIANKIGGVIIEWHPSVQGNRSRNDPNPLPSYPEHAKAWNEKICDAGGVMVVFLLNMNQRYSQTHDVGYFKSIAQEAKSVLNPDCTWIEPTVEPHDEGNRSLNEQKYAAVAAEMPNFKMIMPASCGSNGHANPVFPNQRWDFLDCHTSGRNVEDAKNQALHWLGTTYDAHRETLLVITDGGPLLDPNQSMSVYAELARQAKNRSRYFVLYTDRYAPGNTAAHTAVIDTLATGVR